MVTDERWSSLDGILIKYEATSSVEFLSSGTIVEIPIYSPHIVQTTTIFTISRVEIRFKRLFFLFCLDSRARNVTEDAHTDRTKIIADT